MASLARTVAPRLAAFALALGLCCAAAAVIVGAGSQPADFSREALDRRAPIVAERSYTLKAGVRLLLFWIRRDDIGSGRITWRAGPDGHRVLEFLVGSDPERAPRHINRWGFIAEEVRPPDADLLGIMSKSDEESVDDARSQIAAEAQKGRHPYRGIRTTIRNGAASGGVFHLLSTKSLTYRDLETLLGTVATGVTAPRTVTLPKGTRPGFLFAVEELIVDTLDECRAGLHSEPPSLPYVYNNTFYTLRLRRCDFETRREIGHRAFLNVIRAELETKNTVTGKRTSFRLEYGTSGDLKAVPLRIVFQPKWWFEAELLLDEEAGAGSVRRQGR
jgi:hypothetical protein